MSDLRNKIRDEIFRREIIPFEEFMRFCLYDRELGYYERPRIVGKAGDFYTSVSTGSVFGQLLAAQFAHWGHPLLGASKTLQIAEAGAHDGQLAADILQTLEADFPDIYAGVEYWILEPSSFRRDIQHKVLSRFGTKVRWFESFEVMPSIHGVFFSNELLDAFPVHRVVWDAAQRRWLESFVGWNGASFFIEEGPLTFPAAKVGLPTDLLAHLPDQYRFEVGLAAQDWWRKAAAKLNCGHLIALDYGFTIAEYICSGKAYGTLRAYREHRVTDDLLANVGEQDLTAHVNFDGIREAGEGAGLAHSKLVTQAQFLTAIMEKDLKHKSDSAWPEKALKQFQTLISPDHLGRFRVLIQSTDLQ